MNCPHRQRPARQGFTLIELLVVIAILAVLMSLLTGAVFYALRKADETGNRTDLGKMASQVAEFKRYYKVSYIPSRIKLSETGAYNMSNALDAASLTYLRMAWPKLTFPVDWNGSGAIDPANQDETLEGDQCLVFFLGGIPQTVNGVKSCSGFSTNPANPAMHISKGGDVKTIFEFEAKRLTNSSHPNSKFWSYQDRFGTPYAYFSNYGHPNRYNYFYSSFNNSDCTALGVWPYAQGPRTSTSTFPDLTYLNPDSFQIISAGRNKQFGPGSAPSGTYYWTPTTAAGIGTAGADDISNFAQNVLNSGS